MFESQNASTWTPDQTKDIKFRMRRAAFTPSGTIILNEATLASRNLESDPLYFTNGSSTVTVYHPNHGLFVGSDVILSGIAYNGGSSPNYTVNGILQSTLNTTQTVTAVEMDWYSFTAASTATADGRAGGSAVYATENKAIDLLHPIISDVITPDADVVWGVRTMSGKSLAGGQTPYDLPSDYTTIKVNDNVSLSTPRVILSEADRLANSSSTAKTFYLRGQMSTIRNNVSPIIDLDRVSVICVANRIDNPIAVSSGASSGYNMVQDFVDETAAIGGSVLAKYITKQITLNDPAYGLRIYTGINRPSSSSVTVYYKFLQDGSATKFDDLPWYEVSPTKTVAINDDVTIFDDVTYEVTEAMLQDNVGSTTNVTFTSFAVKIVFTTTNSATVPTIRSFRAIAIS
jgi:hypothetical protein